MKHRYLNLIATIATLGVATQAKADDRIRTTAPPSTRLSQPCGAE
jgi:hypothetical protein